jgi:flagellar hook-length control protein FliK
MSLLTSFLTPFSNNAFTNLGTAPLQNVLPTSPDLGQDKGFQLLFSNQLQQKLNSLQPGEKTSSLLNTIAIEEVSDLTVEGSQLITEQLTPVVQTVKDLVEQLQQKPQKTEEEQQLLAQAQLFIQQFSIEKDFAISEPLTSFERDLSEESPLTHSSEATKNLKPVQTELLSTPMLDQKPVKGESFKTLPKRVKDELAEPLESSERNISVLKEPPVTASPWAPMVNERLQLQDNAQSKNMALKPFLKQLNQTAEQVYKKLEQDTPELRETLDALRVQTQTVLKPLPMVEKSLQQMAFEAQLKTEPFKDSTVSNMGHASTQEDSSSVLLPEVNTNKKESASFFQQDSSSSQEPPKDSEHSKWQDLGGAPVENLEVSFHAQQPTVEKVQQSEILSTGIEVTNAREDSPQLQIIEAVRTQIRQNNQIITLQIKPDILGAVQIKLSPQKGKGFKAEITAEKAETQALLQKNIEELTEKLQKQGLRIEDIQVSLGLEKPQSTQQKQGEFNRHPADQQQAQQQQSSQHQGNPSYQQQLWKTFSEFMQTPKNEDATGYQKYINSLKQGLGQTSSLQPRGLVNRSDTEVIVEEATLSDVKPVF